MGGLFAIGTLSFALMTEVYTLAMLGTVPV